jgi:hypothetical protein
LILVGLFLVPGKSPVENAVSGHLQANAYSASAYENVTIHEGDLIIDGTKTYAIENGTFLVNGNIIVKDDAKLRI